MPLKNSKTSKKPINQGFKGGFRNMIKILFVCHGNICRSPMAEFIMRDEIKKAGLEKEVFVSSAATSTEEIGNMPHPGTRNKLAEFGISTKGKYAVQMSKDDYLRYVYIFGIDSFNIRNIMRNIKDDPENKVCRLLDITDAPKDIDDPWYTGDFDKTYNEIKKGIDILIENLRKNA